MTGFLRKNKLLLALLLIVALTVCTFIMIQRAGSKVRAEARQRFYEQYNRQQSLMAELASRTIEERFDMFHRNLDLVVSLFEGQEVDRQRSEEVRGSLKKVFGSLVNSSVNELVVFDSRGIAITMEPVDQYTLGRSYAWREYYTWAREKGKPGQMYISPFMRMEGGVRRGDMALILAEGIYGAHGEFRGVVICTLNFDRLVRKHILSIHIGKQGRAWLVDSSNRTILVSPNGRVDGRKFEDTLLPRWRQLYNLLVTAEKGQPGGGWYEFEDPDDPQRTVRKLVSHFPVRLEDHLWTLGVATPEREVEGLLTDFLHQQETYTSTLLATILGVALLLFGFLLNWNRILSAQVERHTRDLMEARERLETTFDELLVAKKVAAVGHLALGLVHEIRNPLSAIQMNMQMIRKKIALDGTLRENFSIAEGEIKRLNRLLKDVLDFARSRPLRVQTADLGVIVQRLVVLMNERFEAQQILTDVRIPEPVYLRCDPEQIHQVLLNLVLNAIEAMQDVARERRLVISVTRKDDMAVITVCDTGNGIPREKLGQLFDPFFTTKVAGGGLGLSMLQMIVLQHGGTVAVDSEPDQGATFTVNLPLQGPAATGETL